MSEEDLGTLASHSVRLHFLTRPILQELSSLDLSGCLEYAEGDAISAVAGGYADVFKGSCSHKHRGIVPVAIKRLRFYIKEDIKLLFEKEIYVWSKLRHANILPLLGYSFDNVTGYPSLVSQWMENGSILAYVKSHPQTDLLHLVNGIARGLAYLHEKLVVHSDIKSDNILVSAEGEPLICDFGCARTYYYLARELLTDSSELVQHTFETDVWAFGMTVFELLALERPYDKLSEFQVLLAIQRGELPRFPTSLPHTIEPALAHKLENLCRICWTFNPSERPNMHDVLEQLERYSSSTMLSVSSPSRLSNQEEPGTSPILCPRSFVASSAAMRHAPPPARNSGEERHSATVTSDGSVAQPAYSFSSVNSGFTLHSTGASVTTASASARDPASSTAPGGVKAECANCDATRTPLWRRGLNDELNCNACGLYCKLHKRPRPKSMRNQHGEGRHQSAPRNDSTETMAQCYNCHTTTTPLWRKDDEGKTICNACGLYFKLHGSSRPISMKSDIIRKRSRHNARREGSRDTSSASPGASSRASPSSVGSRHSLTLTPDSSAAQPAYSFNPEDYRMSKRRRMSVDSASEPPSSTASSSPYAGEASSATTASFNFGGLSASNAGNNTFGFSFNSDNSSRSQDAFWHPPMLPQPLDKSSGCFVHPPMLPSDEASSSPNMGFGSPSKDFPMDFLHPPMISGTSAKNNTGGGGNENDGDLFASYLHPPMTVGDESPMSHLIALHLHPPMVPPNEYYSHFQQPQGRGQDQRQDQHQQQHNRSPQQHSDHLQE